MNHLRKYCYLLFRKKENMNEMHYLLNLLQTDTDTQPGEGEEEEGTGGK